MRRINIHTPLVALGILAAATFATPEAEAQQLRFSTTTPGGIASTGNTLGLAKGYNQNGPGTEDAIGTFIALDPNAVDDNPVNSSNPWPAGTTWDWMANGSSGTLALVPEAEVLYAELVWAGSYNYGEDVSAYLDDPVSLMFGNDAVQVVPDSATAQTIAETSSTGFAANYYMRSADVTSFIKTHGAGAYTVAGVPATQTDSINALSAAGWTLVVAFRGEDQPIRNLSVFVGGSFVDEDSVQDYAVSGFCAPPFGPVEGNVVVSALEGDANLAGDDLSIAGTDVGPFVYLSGPNNPEANFFGSQINDWAGMLDTQGTFGMVNHDPFLAENVVGARQGWDLTTIPVSSMDGQLENDQKEAVLRTETVGDSYFPTMMALEIDVKAPDFTDSQTTAMPSSVMLGDQIAVSATLKNSGEAPADDMLFVLPAEPGLELISYETDGAQGDAGGNPVTLGALANGVDAGILEVGTQRTIEMVFEVTSAPQNGTSFMFGPSWEHNFVTCDGEPAIPNSHMPPTAVVQYEAPEMGTGGMAGTGGSEPGTGGSYDPGPDDDGNKIEEEGGCGCTTPGGSEPSWPAALGLSLLALVGLRRRR